MSSTPGRCWPGAFGVFVAVGFLLGSVGEETWGGGWHWDAVAFGAFVLQGLVLLELAVVIATTPGSGRGQGSDRGCGRVPTRLRWRGYASGASLE